MSTVLFCSVIPAICMLGCFLGYVAGNAVGILYALLIGEFGGFCSLH